MRISQDLEFGRDKGPHEGFCVVVKEGAAPFTLHYRVWKKVRRKTNLLKNTR